MKKVFTTLLIGLFFTSAISAQLYFRTGPSLATQTSDQVETSNYVRGYSGFMYRLDMGAFDLRPGLFFSAKGTKVSEFEDSNVKFNYLEIPIDLVYNAGSLDVFAGPYLAYGLSAKATEGEESMDISFEENAERIDFGINVGLSYDITSRFSIGAQYGLGLTNIDKVGEDVVKNRVASVYWSYRITTVVEKE